MRPRASSTRLKQSTRPARAAADQRMILALRTVISEWLCFWIALSETSCDSGDDHFVKYRCTVMRPQGHCPRKDKRDRRHHDQKCTRKPRRVGGCNVLHRCSFG